MKTTCSDDGILQSSAQVSESDNDTSICDILNTNPDNENHRKTNGDDTSEEDPKSYGYEEIKNDLIELLYRDTLERIEACDNISQIMDNGASCQHFEQLIKELFEPPDLTSWYVVLFGEY